MQPVPPQRRKTKAPAKPAQDPQAAPLVQRAVSQLIQQHGKAIASILPKRDKTGIWLQVTPKPDSAWKAIPNKIQVKSRTIRVLTKDPELMNGPRPSTASTNEFPEIGPNGWMGQTWTPPWMADLFWYAMGQCGYNPAKHPQVYDLAAGTGHLVEAIKGSSRLTLNEIDPLLAPVLRSRFPHPHRIHNADFRTLTLPQVMCVVGSPPFIKQGSDYLPQAYVTVCERLLLPGGLLGLLTPDGWTPKHGPKLALLMTRRFTGDQLKPVSHWTEYPMMRFYQKQP